MSDSDVKIQIGIEADTKGADEAKWKLDDLNRKAESTDRKAAPSPQPTARPQQGRSQTASEANAKNGAPDEAERTAAKSARERASEARKVSTESREQLSLEEKKQKIAALHKAADAYDARGDMDVAARSARADAHVLEREVTRETKARSAEEQRITREAKEQEALRRVGIGSSQRRMTHAFSVGRDILTGGNPADTASSALLGAGMRTGNPAIIGTAIVAAIATGVVNTYFSQKEKGLSHENALNESRARGEFQINRQRGVFGSSSGLVGNALAAEQERAEREAHRPELQRQTKFGWYNPLRWSDKFLGTKFQTEGISRGDALMAVSPNIGLLTKTLFPKWSEKNFWKSDQARNADTNDKEIERLKEEEGANRKAAREKFLKEEGGKELKALRGRSKRTMGGQREAFVAEMAEKWSQKYKAAMHQSGDAGLATEMADLTVQNELRDRQAQAGAHLVSAKSGGSEIAAVAGWALRSTAGWQEVVTEIGNLRSDMNRGNQDAGLDKLHK